jgi:chemotaxis signal transduction protein
MKSEEEIAPLKNARMEALRREFDRAFELPVSRRVGETAKLLLFHAGGEAYAVRLAAVHAITELKSVTPLPTCREGLVGIGSVRGGAVAVFSLAAFLGGAQEEPAPGECFRFLLLPQRVMDLGFAVESLDGLISVETRELRGVVSAGESKRAVREVVEIDGETRPVVDLGRIVEELNASNETQPTKGGATS